MNTRVSLATVINTLEILDENENTISYRSSFNIYALFLYIFFAVIYFIIFYSMFYLFIPCIFEKCEINACSGKQILIGTQKTPYNESCELQDIINLYLESAQHVQH